MASLTDDEVRIRILKFFYRHARERPTGTAKFFRPFTRLTDELGVDQNIFEFNMEYLKEKNLIEIYNKLPSPGGWLYASITAIGIDVVERILLLQEESKKPKRDEGKIDRAVQWLNENASWIIPILIDLGLKIPYPS